MLVTITWSSRIRARLQQPFLYLIQRVICNFHFPFSYAVANVQLIWVICKRFDFRNVELNIVTIHPKSWSNSKKRKRFTFMPFSRSNISIIQPTNLGSGSSIYKRWKFICPQRLYVFHSISINLWFTWTEKNFATVASTLPLSISINCNSMVYLLPLQLDRLKKNDRISKAIVYAMGPKLVLRRLIWPSRIKVLITQSHWNY